MEPNIRRNRVPALGVGALLAALLLTGCAQGETSGSGLGDAANPSASAYQSASPAGDAGEDSGLNGGSGSNGGKEGSDQGLRSEVAPESVEIPEEVAEAWGAENVKTLATSATDFVRLTDSQTEFQKPGFSVEKASTALRSVLKPSMEPDAFADLQEQLNSKAGTSIVPMWAGKESVEVGGQEWTPTGEPWVFNYGQPLVEDVEPRDADSIPGVRYSQTTTYYVPVTSKDGATARLSTTVTRAYTLVPGPEKGWRVTGIWASQPTTYSLIGGTP